MQIREASLNILTPDYRFTEFERSVQLSGSLSLSLPETEKKQKKVIQEIKKEKELVIKSKKTYIKSKIKKIEIRFLDLEKREHQAS